MIHLTPRSRIIQVPSMSSTRFCGQSNPYLHRPARSTESAPKALLCAFIPLTVPRNHLIFNRPYEAVQHPSISSLFSVGIHMDYPRPKTSKGRSAAVGAPNHIREPLSDFYTMASNAPSHLKIDSSCHSATIILMHGMGNSGQGMHPIANLFHQDPELQHIKWILPDAPVRAMAANGNQKMQAWYNVYNFEFEGKQDETGMFESVRSIQRLINQEIASGIDPSRIVLAGFMQGGSLSLLTGLTTQIKLAGIAVLSGRVPISERIKELAPVHASSLPIFWGYNVSNPLAKFRLNQVAVKFLTEEMGFTTAPTTGEAIGIELHGYEGLGTGISQPELRDLGEWLKRVLPAAG
ncbi:Phospholipase/Carboxylesterase-domain-containing protein [Mycena galopus ATCC 62051]|nr:Phospholipase/Carboxylesterase-domain-containing protein [Mycena galopus ATCC 62051]